MFIFNRWLYLRTLATTFPPAVAPLPHSRTLHTVTYVSSGFSDSRVMEDGSKEGTLLNRLPLLSRCKISIINIYRHPSSATLSKSFSIFSNTLIISFLSLLPRLMNSSSPVTLTFILIIPQITSPPSFYLFSHLSTSVNTWIFVPTTKTTFLTWS